MSDGDPFRRNLAALLTRSPVTAARVRAVANDAAVQLVRARSGDPVVEVGGRAFDSRIDPVVAADRLAATAQASPVVVAGFGTGYLVEALIRRGVRVTAVIEPSAASLAVALRARGLEATLASVPVVLIDALHDPVELARLRAGAAHVVPHGPSVTGSAELAALIARWASIRVSDRPPRVLVVGPIYGGSLEVARAAARACDGLGVETRLFDASAYATAHDAFDALDVAAEPRRGLQAALVCLLGRGVLAVAADLRPDLVVALAQAPLDTSTIETLRGAGIRTAFWFVENGRILTYWKQMAAHYDRFYAIQSGRFLEQLAEAGAAHPAYLPLACDAERHRPVCLTPDDETRYASDVSFAGSAYLNRRRMFAMLTDFGLRLWGPGWVDGALAPCVAEGGRPFDLDEMLRIFAGTRVNLNLHSANHVDGCDPDPDYVNPRTFELAACGAFQLVDHRLPLRELFRDDEVVTFADVAELRTKVSHYLARGDERHACAARARTRVLASHTYTHRMRVVLRDTLPPELVAAATRPSQRPRPLVDVLAQCERESPTLRRDEALMRVVHDISAEQAAR